MNSFEIFLWKIARNVIPTQEVLKNRFELRIFMFAMSRNLETPEHLLISFLLLKSCGICMIGQSISKSLDYNP